MTGENQFPATTRAEMIRLARESCNEKRETYNMNQEGIKEESKKKQEHIKTKEEPLCYVQDEQERKKLAIQPVKTSSLYMKMFLIRVVCAVVCCLAVILIDRLSIGKEYIQGEQIKQVIQSNVTIEELEQFVSEFASENILPVFSQSDPTTQKE